MREIAIHALWFFNTQKPLNQTIYTEVNHKLKILGSIFARGILFFVQKLSFFACFNFLVLKKYW